MRKKKLLIIMVVSLVILAPISYTLGRYAVENIKNYIMETNKFFFSSDKLVEGGITYEVNNWGGADSFDIQFELNNRKNSSLLSDDDITYSLSYSCDDSVTCALDTTSGTLTTTEESDNFTLSVSPNRVFDDNESVTINVSATSSSPYVKTLSATYVITVGVRGISYQITDEVDSPYLTFAITNAIDTYTCRKAYGSYVVGDAITYEQYLAVPDNRKSRFTSRVVTLSWNPTYVLLDTTSDILDSVTSKSYKTVSGVSYIKKIVFPVDILSSTNVRFYKVTASNDYTYPYGTATSSIITFSAK